MDTTTAAWRHLGAREGFEVVVVDGGRRYEGTATAVEDGVPWAVTYAIEVDAAGATRRADVRSRWAGGSAAVTLRGDGAGRWTVDGAPAAQLDGLLDVDLEASAMTNAFPVGRLGLARGAAAEAPAVYVRAPDLRVERLAQRYRCVGAREYDYESPGFGFHARLRFAPDGLVADYPGIAVRVR